MVREWDNEHTTRATFESSSTNATGCWPAVAQSGRMRLDVSRLLGQWKKCPANARRGASSGRKAHTCKLGRRSTAVLGANEE